MAILTPSAKQQFFDANGNPLSGGKLYTYAAGTTTPLATYTDSGAGTPNTNPIVLDSRGEANVWLGSANYKFVLTTSTGVEIWTVDGISSYNYDVLQTLAASGGAALVGFIQAGTGAVATTVQGKARQVVSVFDYMTAAQQADVSSGAGLIDVTAAITAALNYVKTTAFSEKELVFPAGAYRVSKIDFTGVNFCTFRALGTVQIKGVGTSDFVFGCDGYIPSGVSTFSNSNKFIGGTWLVANSGGTYTHIFKFTAANNCVFENFSVSGSCGATSGADRIAAAINYCWVNRFINFNVGSPGTPGAGFRSFCWAVGPLGGDNVNSNVWESCRMQASALGAPYTGGVGIYLSGGTANAVRTCDISALDVGIELNNMRGSVFENNYHEAVNTIVRMVSGNSRGNTFIGGYYEVKTNGVAFSLSSSQNTAIIGGQYSGVAGGSNRTFIAQGAGCYGLTVAQPELQNIDNNITGTYNGTGGVSGAQILQAQWLSFPSTQVSSSDVNTLDDYEESAWTPASNGDAFSSAVGRYTKIGDVVVATFIVQYPATANGATAQITGWPFAASGANSEHNGFSVGYNTSAKVLSGSLANSTFTFRSNGASGATIKNSDLTGAYISGVVTYKTAT